MATLKSLILLFLLCLVTSAGVQAASPDSLAPDSCYISVPNVLTPNHDGIDYAVYATATCPLAEFKWRIFNRWGNEVYSSTDITEGWDGTNGKEDVPIGTYYWVISCRFAEVDYEGEDISGSITVIR